MDRLCQQFPVLIQLGQQIDFVDFQFADAFQRGMVRDQRITKTNTEVTQHGGVRQITLPARDWQFAGQMLENRVSDTEVAFGVFKINRIDFMWHRGRTNLAGNGTLLEVAKRNVTPDVPIKIDQDGVKAGDCIKQFSNIIMRFNLRGVRVPAQAQAGNELL